MSRGLQTKISAEVRKLVDASITTFYLRAAKWEAEQGDLGKVVASEIRVVVGAFEEILNPRYMSEIEKRTAAMFRAYRKPEQTNQ